MELEEERTNLIVDLIDRFHDDNVTVELQDHGTYEGIQDMNRSTHGDMDPVLKSAVAAFYMAKASVKIFDASATLIAELGSCYDNVEPVITVKGFNIYTLLVSKQVYDSSFALFADQTDPFKTWRNQNLSLLAEDVGVTTLEDVVASAHGTNQPPQKKQRIGGSTTKPAAQSQPPRIREPITLLEENISQNNLFKCIP